MQDLIEAGIQNAEEATPLLNLAEVYKRYHSGPFSPDVSPGLCEALVIIKELSDTLTEYENSMHAIIGAGQYCECTSFDIATNCRNKENGGQQILQIARNFLSIGITETKDQCNPSVSYLARLTSLSERAIQYAIQKLVSEGHVSRQSNAGKTPNFRLHPRNHCAPLDEEPPQPLHPATIAPVQSLREGVQPLHRGGATIAATPATIAPKPEEPEENQKGTRITEGASPKVSKEDWRSHNRRIAIEANAVNLPLSGDAFPEAWLRWCEYRTGRAVDARIASEAIPWTAASAKAALRGCETHAGSVGWKRISERIDEAIGGHWQGLNLDKITNGYGAKPANGTNGHAPSKFPTGI